MSSGKGYFSLFALHMVFAFAQGVDASSSSSTVAFTPCAAQDGPLSPEPDAMSPEDPAALARMGWQSPSDDNGLGGLAWEESAGELQGQ